MEYSAGGNTMVSTNKGINGNQYNLTNSQSKGQLQLQTNGSVGYISNKDQHYNKWGGNVDYKLIWNNNTHTTRL